MDAPVDCSCRSFREGVTVNRSTVLFPGRFQPLHNGHAEIIGDLAERFERVIVAIAMAQLSHMKRHPLTGGERYDLIREFVLARRMTNVEIIPIPVNCYLTTWVAAIRALCPPFQAVYARNPVMRAIFAELEYPLVSPVFPRRMTGVAIRGRIASGQPWNEFVPREVAEFLERRKLTERIREVSKDEND
jgi:nicotinamide-nucleotide adenylyltransferase